MLSHGCFCRGGCRAQALTHSDKYCKFGHTSSTLTVTRTVAGQRHLHSRAVGVTAETTPEARWVSTPRGPQGAFVPGQEADARRQLFNRIAPIYDELNDRLSFGQHWVWKQMAVQWSGARPGQRVLDVCCGSGDLALLLARAVGPKGMVVGVDFAADMLTDAEQRQCSHQANELPRNRTPMEWVQGDAMDLPFSDGEFDAATMGYGLRNVADISKALRELQRVLKPGASVAVLDFNNSKNPVVDGAQALMLERLVVPAAAAYGLEAEYEYLRPSIKKFPMGPELELLACAAGFKRAVHHEISFGLMGVLVATKGK